MDILTRVIESPNITLQKRERHEDRIVRELRKAGVTSYGRLKFVGRHISSIVRPEEHIEAAVYGRYQESTWGLLSFAAGWLIATDHRMIFIDWKPGFIHFDELGYDAVTGQQKTQAGFFASYTLHTKSGDRVIRFANKRCVNQFMQVVEARKLYKVHHASLRQSVAGVSVESDQEQATSSINEPDNDQHATRLTSQADRALIQNFIAGHTTAVLSTATPDAEVYGAAVYYVTDVHENILVLTKDDTEKAHNVFANPHVSLTIFDNKTLQTAQIQGIAQIETNLEKKQQVFSSINRRGLDNVPIGHVDKGKYLVLRIQPQRIGFSDFTHNLQAEIEL